MSPTLRSLFAGLALAAGTAAVWLLLTSLFFVGWDGIAVSAARPSGDVQRVRIVAADGSYTERSWPSPIVGALRLPIDGSAAPRPGATGPRTTKSRLSLSFTVDGVDGPIGTTSRSGLAAAVFAGLLAWAGRNMLVGGAPWALVPRDRARLRALSPSGAPAPLGSRSKAGPPPPRPVVGRGRR